MSVNKPITIGGLITVVLMLVLFNSFPSSDTTDVKSTLKNTETSIKTDVVIDATNQIIEDTSKTDISISCRDSGSKQCHSTTSAILLISIAWVLFIAVLLIAGVVGAIFFVLKVFHQLFG